MNRKYALLLQLDSANGVPVDNVKYLTPISGLKDYCCYSNPELMAISSEIYRLKSLFRLSIFPDNLTYKHSSNAELKSAIEEFIKTNSVFDYTNKYLVNLDKWQYIKLDPENEIYELPLLCTKDNGKGEGDYFGINQELVGSWIYDRLKIESDISSYRKIEEIDSYFYET